MANETPTSPPGSWPETSEKSDGSSDERRHSTPEREEDVVPPARGILKGKEKNKKDVSKRKAMLPPEILEQYA